MPTFIILRFTSIIVIALFELVLMNYFAQKIINSNDQVLNSAYCDTHWYRLPPKLRRDIYIIMVCSTNTSGLTLGKMRKANMETAGIVSIFINTTIIRNAGT